MSKLNPQQQAVVAHPNTPLLVIAGAGTGKTTVMAHRAAALVHGGLPPARLLLLTFTRRAAEELRSRVAAQLGTSAGALPWCGTFHGIAARLLRTHGRHVGLGAAFTILDETDSRELLGAVAAELFPECDKSRLPGKALLRRVASYAVNTRLPLDNVIAELAPDFVGATEDVRRIVEGYEERKRLALALDFDDLLGRWLDLLRSPHAGIPGMFDAVMVDEYQDTNVIQSEILHGLCQGHGNVTVVGDDAQAIYAFRGATVENILAFEHALPGVSSLKLESNYRSTPEILDAANALWAEAARGYAKHLVAVRGPGLRPRLETCQDDWDQAERVVAQILHAWQTEGLPLAEQAVLFRSSHHSFALEARLQKYRIPFRKYGGQRFAESAHIKDALAFLRCRENLRDETAWRRVFQILPGIGPATSARFSAQLRGASDAAAALERLRFPKSAQASREGLLAVFATLFGDGLTLERELTAIVDFYQPFLALLYDAPEIRIYSLRELAVLAARYASRREFLDEMLVGDDSVLEAPDAQPEDCLTLSTIHSAKGCEWRAVHVIQLVEGGLPAAPSQEDAMKIDEERRLLYVAMTRARDRLTLFHPQERETIESGGRKRSAYRLSRFLTPRVLACLDSPYGAPADEPVYVYDDGRDSPPAGCRDGHADAPIPHRSSHGLRVSGRAT